MKSLKSRSRRSSRIKNNKFSVSSGKCSKVSKVKGSESCWYKSSYFMVSVAVILGIVVLGLISYYVYPLSDSLTDDSAFVDELASEDGEESNIAGEAFRLPRRSDVSRAVQQATDPCNVVSIGRITRIQENDGARFTILLIGDHNGGYTNDRSLYNDAVKLADYNDGGHGGLFSIEPFKSNRELFNIYSVRATVKTNLIRSGGASAKAASITLANCAAGKVRERYLSQIRNRKITHVAAVSKQNFRSICIPETPCLVAVGSSVDRNDGRLLTHEFAHGFGGLADEYVDSDATESLAELGPISRILFGRSINNELDFFSTIGIIAPPNCASTREWQQSEAGCGFSDRLYKPAGQTIMGHNRATVFGSVNEQRLQDVIDGRTTLARRGSAVDQFQRYK